MKAEPLVCCIMLTRDRPEMAQRAGRCFREQRYKNRVLQIWSTSGFPDPERDRPANEFFTEDVPDYSIGELRNRANGWHNAFDAAILIHWDDDDVSHPSRIAEQVALLQSSGKAAVGYREVLFWRDPPGEAWLFHNHPSPAYCIGSSLAYWRRTWEARHFPDLPKGKGSTGEDTEWLKGVDSLGVDSVRAYQGFGDPRMICSIHGGNTSTQYETIGDSRSWKRVPEWDEHCRKVMAL